MLNLGVIPEKLSILRQKKTNTFFSFLLMFFQYLLVAIFSILDRSILWYLLVTEKNHEICKKNTDNA